MDCSAGHHFAERAELDQLTGLANRWGWDDHSARIFEAAALTGDWVALLAVDVDHFKRTNDTWGHAAGDRVLAAVAEVFRQRARRGDLLCRSGGDEFLLLLPGADVDGALALTADLHKMIRDLAVEVPALAHFDRFDSNEGLPTSANSETSSIFGHSVSIGVAALRFEGDLESSVRVLMLSADGALLRAKKAGRGRTAVAGCTQMSDIETATDIAPHNPIEDAQRDHDMISTIGIGGLAAGRTNIERFYAICNLLRSEWVVNVLMSLSHGTLRNKEILSAAQLNVRQTYSQGHILHPKALARVLRRLERAGLIVRHEDNSAFPTSVSYQLTVAAKELLLVLDPLVGWSTSHDVPAPSAGNEW